MNCKDDAEQLNLPLPNESACEISDELQSVIREEIDHCGPMNFARFMSLALYAPGLGYYVAGAEKLGKDGDFTTAPEISSLFGKTLAFQCQQILTHVDQPTILEFGAGSGKLAADLLNQLAALDSLPDTYFILDISPDLKQRQQQTIKQYAPEHLHRVQWLHSLPGDDFNGVVIANEVLDAMPVHKCHYDGKQWLEYVVNYQNDQWCWELKPASKTSVKRQLKQINPPAGYDVEINPNIAPWIMSINDRLNKGLILIIDYGLSADALYHPERSMGSLMCHYRHHAHPDPLRLVGLQDITAYVNFSEIANCTDDTSLEVAGYTTQANFLINCGITDLINPNDHTETRAAKTLLLPTEMGEAFKVIGLTKDISQRLIGFAEHNLNF